MIPIISFLSQTIVFLALELEVLNLVLQENRELQMGPVRSDFAARAINVTYLVVNIVLSWILDVRISCIVEWHSAYFAHTDLTEDLTAVIAHFAG